MSLNAIARVSAAAGRSKLSTEMQQAIAAIDPNVPADPLLTVSELESQATAYPRFRAILLTSFAVAALLLATIGLFGVLSHSVAQRRHEIGVRMALGAEKSTVVLMILKEGFLLTCAGILWHGCLLGTGPLSFRPSLWSSARPAALRRHGFRLAAAAFCAIYLPALRRAAKVRSNDRFKVRITALLETPGASPHFTRRDLSGDDPNQACSASDATPKVLSI